MHIPVEDVLWYAPAPQILAAPPRGRVLCLAPHPDDECIGPGGSLALHRRQGDAVRVVIATDGQAGDPDGRFERASYAELRRCESRAGLAELGVHDVDFWGYPDSYELTQSDIDLVAQRVGEELERHRPDVVYCPWEGEGNTDHRALYVATYRALKRARYPGIVHAYEIWNLMVPDVIVDVSAVIDAKERAIRGFASQMAYTDILRPTLGLNASRSMIFNHGVGYGEAFRKVVLP